jgi:hypothetical protein
LVGRRGYDPRTEGSEPSVIPISPTANLLLKAQGVGFEPTTGDNLLCINSAAPATARVSLNKLCPDAPRPPKSFRNLEGLFSFLRYAMKNLSETPSPRCRDYRLVASALSLRDAG